MPLRSLFIAVGQKASGKRPSAVRAVAGATAAGTATAAVVYKLLRREPDSDGD